MIKQLKNAFDTWNEDFAVCPWCGYVHQDSFEFNTGSHNCHNCNKPFYLEVETSVTYTTTKEQPTNGQR